MNKRSVISLTLLALFTGNTWAAGVVVVPPRNSETTSVACSGNYLGDKTFGTVKYRAVYEANIYAINLELNLTGAIPGNPTTLYSRYEDGWYTNAEATTPFTSMTQIPSYSGYDFLGFFTCAAETCAQIIDANGALVSGASTTVMNNLVAHWAHSCVAKLHIGDDELCLYTEKVSDSGNPSLVIQKSSTSPKYYAAMSPAEDNKTIHSESSTKLYIKYGNDIYNVHDKTVH